MIFDLLDTSLYLELSRDPHRIEAIVGNQPPGRWIVLDEIQKISALLDEVHRREEGLVRSLPPFLRFLAVAGQLNGQPVQGQNIAREAALPRSTVDAYFSILIDTLMGHFLPAPAPITSKASMSSPPPNSSATSTREKFIKPDSGKKL